MAFILFGRKFGLMEALPGNVPSTHSYTSQPVLTKFGPTLWVTGFNKLPPGLYPKHSESHLGMTRWNYARMEAELESCCGSKVTCGHCSVPSAAAPDLALGMLEGGQSHCYHQRGSLLNR